MRAEHETKYQFFSTRIFWLMNLWHAEDSVTGPRVQRPASSMSSKIEVLEQIRKIIRWIDYLFHDAG
jgi:hypothetical protein